MKISKSLMRSLLTGAAIAAVSMASSAAVQAQEGDKIRILLPNENTTTLYPHIVARELNLCEDENLDIEVLSSATTVPYVAFLSTGDADLVMLDAPQTFQAANTAQAVSVVYEGMQYAPEAVGVNAESEIKSVAELKGKTVGLASDRDRTTLSVFLDTAGLTLDDVETAVVGDSGATLANAIKNQTVAAVSAGLNDFAVLKGYDIEMRDITPQEVQAQPANSFAISSERKEEIKPVVERFLRCWTKGNVVGEIDPQVVAAVMRESNQEEWENEDAGQALLDASLKFNLSVTEKTGDLQPQVWKDIQGPYVKFGMIDQEIDPAKFLDDSFIDAANDFDRVEVEKKVEEWKAANPDKMKAPQ